MDGRRRLYTSQRAASSLCSHGASDELWHSTPLKEKDAGSPLNPKQSCGLTRGKMSDTAAGAHYVHNAEFPVKDLSNSTIQRQRRELQLLMAELTDRERELNAMSASHHEQRQAWEQDRQTAVTLEKRCACLDEELQRRNEVINVLTKHVWVVESREKEVQMELSKAKQMLWELENKQQHLQQKCQDYEAKNQSLSSTVTALSTQVGSLRVREEELSSMLKLKDKDASKASSRSVELSGRLEDLQTALAESRSAEDKLLTDLEGAKRRYREAEREVSQLREELQQQVNQSSTQREEIIRLKQELQLLHTDLALTGEGESWKDELLELSRSKQERVMSELLCLRQLCENQRNDLQRLRLNQERAQGVPGEKHHWRLIDGQDESAFNRGDRQSKSPRPDLEILPDSEIQDSNSKVGGFPSKATDIASRLSACSLQQLLGNSAIVGLRHRDSSQPAGRVLNYHAAYCPPSMTTRKTSDTPPKACVHHVSRRDSNVDT